MPGYAYPRFPFRRCGEQEGEPCRHPVAIVGGGPVGLTAALELAARGVASVVFEDSDTVSEGSRALCWSKRSLEILDRHGIAARMLEIGYTWNAGRVYRRDREVFRFELQPQGRHKHPAFINLQQYHTEALLIEAARGNPLIELRFQSRVTAVRADAAGAMLEVETPDGSYVTACDWLLAADGARSTIRRCLGLDFQGQVFEDRFLIADVEVLAELPSADRRFWFQPGFDPCQTALCHKQGDNLWRVDFQLGADCDPDLERQPERVLERVRRMLGEHPMELHWISIYTFQARRLSRLRHGRVLFAGDAAHQMSPFGARGGNSGIQDVENLAWKLALVIGGQAGDSLLDSFDAERGQAAAENLRITSRTTNFLTPKTPAARMFREAVLDLAERFAFARALVNSGRLSTPTCYRASPLSTETEGFDGGVPPGTPCPNLPLSDAAGSFLLDRLRTGFTGLWFRGEEAAAPEAVAALEQLGKGPVPVETIVVGGGDGAPFPSLPDPDGALEAAFAAGPGTYYLIRPDRHVAGRWHRLEPAAVAAALARALGKETAS